MIGRRFISLFKRSPSSSSSSSSSSTEKVPKSWGRRIVSGGVALSALDDLIIYHACSRNLPTTVTSQEIYQEFKNFGKITQDGVILKKRLDVGICFAFIEFEDVSGARKAIEASPIQLAGRQVYIVERRANSSGGTRGGRGRGGARGRGSYGGVSNGRGNGSRKY